MKYLRLSLTLAVFVLSQLRLTSSLGFDSHDAEEIFVEKKRAVDMITEPDQKLARLRKRAVELDRVERSADQRSPDQRKLAMEAHQSNYAKDLGADRWIKKPGRFRYRSYIPNYTYLIKELKELRSFPGAYWSLPSNFRFDYMPSGDEFWKVVRGEGRALDDLVSMVFYEQNKKKRKIGHTVNQEFISLYYRYGRCLGDIEKTRNCPNPCNKPGSCYKTPHATGLCRAVSDPSLKVNINQYHPYWNKMFQKKKECQCEKGYAWNEEKQTCEDVYNDCKSRIDRTAVCRNGGTCRQDPERGFACECMPAFTGVSCQVPRDPCMGETVCGKFECRRDPANWVGGYTCMCNSKPGFERFSPDNPECVDIDECKMRPCMNGATCNNTVGSYFCSCPEDFVGINCEHRDYKPPTWSDWGPYLPCTVTCGLDGRQASIRKCDSPGKCIGTNTKHRKCRDVPKHCPKSAVFDDTFGVALNPDQSLAVLPPGVQAFGEGIPLYDQQEKVELVQDDAVLVPRNAEGHVAKPAVPVPIAPDTAAYEAAKLTVENEVAGSKEVKLKTEVEAPPNIFQPPPQEDIVKELQQIPDVSRTLTGDADSEDEAQDVPAPMLVKKVTPQTDVDSASRDIGLGYLNLIFIVLCQYVVTIGFG